MDKRTFLQSMGILAASQLLPVQGFAAESNHPLAAEWSINMTVLESCSCPVFCQCFFVGKPPETSSMRHGKMMKEHVCRFNQTYIVNHGNVGSVRLDGAKFWFSGNAGATFATPKLEWAVLTFDPSVSPEQRSRLLVLLRMHSWYRPERWKSYTVADDAPVGWSAASDGVHATLGGGSIAETKTSTMIGLQGKPVTIDHLGYFGFTRNSGFVLMPADLVAYRKGDHAFEYKDTNGLLTTVDMNSHDVKA